MGCQLVKPFSKRIVMLKCLLFKSADGMSAPFSSQRELARTLCDKLDLPADKHNSTAVFLNQILHGKRSMPENWRRALMEILEDRGLNEETRGLIAIAYGASPSGLAPLLQEQADASDVLILNACPTELTDARQHHKEARLLEQLVLSGLMRGCRYHYCLATQQDARRLWTVIRENAEKTFDESTNKNMRDWVGKSLLRVSIVPELLLLHPTVGFNTHSPDHLSVFVWHAPYDWEHCLRLPERQLSTWLGSVCRILNTQAQQVPFEA
ncbi:MAG: hypothetical protein NUV84_01750 [Candidatus Uhrbacteria bacterium]|nr:hypothetical protein [Candidatus Uhrbacteria bacterium]